jgi:hypothetical protein
VLFRPLAEMAADGVTRHSQIPTQLSLGQNHPNPFNAITKIAFTLSAKSFVSLKIFDRIGREIAMLVSEELPAGSHCRQWNALEFPSGVYFYRLKIGDQTVAIKKLTLLK